MIDADKRKAVFLLHQEGIGRNQIARAAATDLRTEGHPCAE